MTKQISEVTLDGKRYISAKRAAEISEYSNDYIGQLCRSGKIEATRIGRNWYVEEASILGHKNSSQSDVKSDESTLGDTSESFVYKEPSGNIARSIKQSLAVYSADESPLLPVLKDVNTERGNFVPIRVEEPKDDEVDTNNIPVSLAPRKQIFPLVTIWKTVVISIIFLIVSFGVFTLNGVYAMTIIKDVLSESFDEFSQTETAIVLKTEVLEPYEYVAIEVNEIIDYTVFNFIFTPLYKDLSQYIKHEYSK